jgi:APA family basic amino acid/polyamine antiporter
MNRVTAKIFVVPQLQRRLGVVDFTLITIGAIIGSGIFRNPAVVAQRAHVPALIMGCWIAGGVMALIGAFVFAELAARRPIGGGFYAYLRDAYSPAVAFLLGWMSLLIIYTGSTAASAVLFSEYLLPLLHVNADSRLVALSAIACVTMINVLGVRQGSTWLNILVALKVFGIAGIIVAGLMAHPIAPHAPAAVTLSSPLAWLTAAGIAMLPALFSYMGFQSATYVIGETRDPGTTVPRGQIFGVGTVVAIYLLVNVASLRALGASGLAATTTPAADVMAAAFGHTGRLIVSAVIAISTLGYMSGAILCGPRLYFQMAADGVFFKHIAWISPRTHVPVVAIAVHGSIAAIIAVSGTYGQIVNWVTLPEWLFIMLVAASVFIYRKRDAQLPRPAFVVPFHPWSTLLLIVAIITVAIAVVATSPMDSLFGGIVLVTGLVFFYVWKALRRVTGL